MTDQTTTTAPSTGTTLLLIAFIVLKLTGVIAWSWWWVLSPLWIPVLLALAVLVVVAFMKTSAKS